MIQSIRFLLYDLDFHFLDSLIETAEKVCPLEPITNR